MNDARVLNPIFCKDRSSVIIPCVSIGMPVFNGEKYIREAIDTLLRQTFVDFELIISDNASTDGTRVICEDYSARDSRVRFFCHDYNQGAFENFKFVLSQARGKYFMWAAADDKWSANWIEFLLHAHHKSSALTFGEVLAFGGDDDVSRHCRNFKFTGQLLLRSLKFVFQDEYEGKANLIYGMFKVGVIRKVMRTEKSWNYFSADVLALFSVLQYGEISASKGAYLYKREGGAGDLFLRGRSVFWRLIAPYLVPYFFSFVKRARGVGSVVVFLLIPFLLFKVYAKRLVRFFNRS